MSKAVLAKQLAAQVGLDRIGVTHAGPVERAAYYRNWLAAGYAGDMRYLAADQDSRERPDLLLPGARSILCAAMNYHCADSAHDAAPARTAPAPNPPSSHVEHERLAGAADAPAQSSDSAAPVAARPAGRIAQYARGRDYHHVLSERLRDLMRRLRAALNEPFEYRICVDTAPLLERELAARAGIGWIGKNTCVLNESLGSYLFLGEVLTTLDLAPDDAATDHCGSCTRCLDACPTAALPAPYQIDASRCIAYLTIEHRGPIAEEFHAPIGDWVFGCDICQDVCPFNRRAPQAADAELLQPNTPARVDLLDLLHLRGGGYRRLTRKSAARRADCHNWRRNAAIALGNVGGPDAPTLAALKAAAEYRNEGVRAAAQAALRRLQPADDPA